MRHVAVTGDVVAGHHGERGHAPLAASGQALHHESEDRCRRRGSGTIGHDVRVVGVELAGGRREVVTALGDCQGHDAHGRVGELLENGLRIVGGIEVLDDRADHRRLHRTVGMLEGQGVQTVLWHKRIPHPRVGGPHADTADSPRRIGREQLVDVEGLVRAMEAADPEVHDARGDRRAVVARCRHVTQRTQGVGVEWESVGEGAHERSFRVDSGPPRVAHLETWGWTTALIIPGMRSESSASAISSSP